MAEEREERKPRLSILGNKRFRSRQKLYPIDRLCTLVCTVFRSFARAVFAEA